MTGAAVVHGHEDALDGDAGVDAAGDDLVVDVDDAGEPFEAEVFALNGDEEPVGGGEGGRHEDAEGGRAVDDDEVEAAGFAERGEDVAETGEVIVRADEIDFSAGEFGLGGDEGEPGEPCGLDFGEDAVFADEDAVETLAFDGAVAEGAGCVALGGEVDEEDTNAAVCEAGGEIYGSRGFGDSPFLVDDCDDFHAPGQS